MRKTALLFVASAVILCGSMASHARNYKLPAAVAPAPAKKQEEKIAPEKRTYVDVPVFVGNGMFLNVKATFNVPLTVFVHGKDSEGKDILAPVEVLVTPD